MEFTDIDIILEAHGHRHSAVIGIMQDVQARRGYLSEKALRHISSRLELPLSRIFDIATFYKGFSLHPRGRHIIRVCTGTACHLGGTEQNMGQIERSLNLRDGGTSEDMKFSLETVNCLGTCALAPVVVVDEEYYDGVTPGKLGEILSNYE